MLPSSVRILVCTQRQDMRRSFDTLAAAVVRDVMGEEPQRMSPRLSTLGVNVELVGRRGQIGSQWRRCARLRRRYRQNCLRTETSIAVLTPFRSGLLASHARID